jgi:peptidoglycan hydrolase CwlO-like protein
LEIGELQSKVKSANEIAEDYKKKFEQVKKDMIQLKRQIDKEKEITLTKQAEELEQLK